MVGEPREDVAAPAQEQETEAQETQAQEPTELDKLRSERDEYLQLAQRTREEYTHDLTELSDFLEARGKTVSQGESERPSALCKRPRAARVEPLKLQSQSGCDKDVLSLSG